MVLNKPGTEPTASQRVPEFEAQSDHLKIISSPAVVSLIDDWYRKTWIKAELTTAVQDPRYSILLSRENAATGELIPVSLDATSWLSDPDEKLIIDLNTKSLAMAGRKPSDVAEFANAAKNPTERASLFAVAASSASQPKDRFIWTGEMARASYNAANFEEAKRSAIFTSIAINQSAIKDDGDLKIVDQEAKTTAGWSYLREGDLTSFSRIASEYGSGSGALSRFREPTSVFGGSSPEDFKDC